MKKNKGFGHNRTHKKNNNRTHTSALLWPYISILIINSDMESTCDGSSADQKGISWGEKDKIEKKKPHIANRHKNRWTLFTPKQSQHY